QEQRLLRVAPQPALHQQQQRQRPPRPPQPHLPLQVRQQARQQQRQQPRQQQRPQVTFGTMVTDVTTPSLLAAAPSTGDGDLKLKLGLGLGLGLGCVVTSIPSIILSIRYCRTKVHWRAQAQQQQSIPSVCNTDTTTSTQTRTELRKKEGPQRRRANTAKLKAENEHLMNVIRQLEDENKKLKTKISSSLPSSGVQKSATSNSRAPISPPRIS
ncbi:unnamed protein product, partial [Didymodactylos carnosus]